MVDAALAAAHPHIWSAPGFLHPSSRSGTSTAQADALREKMVRALEAASAAAPAPERSDEAGDLAIELGRLAARVARLAPAQADGHPAVFTEVVTGPSPEGQLIVDFYTEVKTDKMGTVTGFELGALDGRLIEVRDEIGRLRAALKAAGAPLPDAQLIIDFYQEVSRDHALPVVLGEDIGALTARVVAVRDELKRQRELVERGDHQLRVVRQEAARQIAVSTSRIELLNEEIRSLNRKLTVKAAPAPETKSTTPPPSDDPIEKMFDTVLGWAERGLDAINTKLADDKKKDDTK
jgi:hypothetical protein